MRLGVQPPRNHSGTARVQLQGLAVTLEGFVNTPSAILAFIIYLPKEKKKICKLSKENILKGNEKVNIPPEEETV